MCADRITIDYPAAGAIFPPDIAPPTFIWRDASAKAAIWRIDVGFGGRSHGLHVTSSGERMQIGALDERCLKAGGEIPKLTPEQVSAHTWKPDAALWTSIKKQSAKKPAHLTITGFADERMRDALSEGEVTFDTSKDPVGAPIFYRDVPLIPVPTERGVIKPLPSDAIPLIAWRLRSIADSNNKVIMEGLPTCANCHSFSSDGKTLGLDVDGPQNDKGLYALVPVSKRMSIRDQDVIRWSSFRDTPSGKRFGFMSQVSPDGQYVVTTIEDPRAAIQRGVDDRFFNAGYKDYHFGQVFYPTKGILAWYSRETRKLQPLPGADDPKYVQTNAVWSPDGKYLVFARAEAREPYHEGQPAAEYANDPNETQIQYDLYRIAFNGGKGGVPERIEGASQDGMSNNFAKVSPDGKWIVYVRCKNGLLMRPDSQLYIVPFQGGEARRLDCNTPLMNSWHSFSPNGRWMVFSSKYPSGFTQMFLTHIDEDGRDSPAILIEHATEANRAVNIPEFVNIAADGMEKIETPATEFYRLYDLALTLALKGQYAAAIPEWTKAIELSPDDAKTHNNLAIALAHEGHVDEALPHYEKAVTTEPSYADAHVNYGVALAAKRRLDEAITEFEKAIEIAPDNAKAHGNLAGALIERGRLQDAIPHCEKALQIDPEYTEADNNLAIALMRTGRLDESIPHFAKALVADPDSVMLHFNLARALAMRGRVAESIPHFEKASSTDEPVILGTIAAVYAQTGRMADALETARRALRTATARNDQELIRALTDNIRLYESAIRR